ncbi:MAG TPA: cytochrome c biogenesis protein CcsA [Casimicrobiaceae bacterium]|nr:cytochrome c biogenesis protein CcsA [Casimicrobiaceae bacterium]
MTILLHVLVAALYAATAWARWPRSVPPSAERRRLGEALLAVALVLHAVAIWQAIVRPDGLDLSFVNALSLVAGLAVLAAWVSGVMRALPAVAAVVLPVAAACALLPPLAGSPHRVAFSGDPWAEAHIAVALVAYALFVVVALQSLVVTGLEKRLHRGLPDAARGTPPLLTLERYMFRLLGLGFVLLTATLVSGMLFSEEIFGKAVPLNHKNVFSVAGWLAFAILLFGRWRHGWRGRTAMKWIVGGTLLLVLGYLGSKFVREIVLGR